MSTKSVSKNSQPLATSKFFRPLIASSLALTLGASVAVGTPIFEKSTTYDGSYNQAIDSTLGITWTNGVPYAGTGVSQAIETLRFNFTESTSQSDGTLSNNKLFTVNLAKSNRFIELDGKGSSIAIGAGGTGKMTINMQSVGVGNENPKPTRIFNLNLSQLSDQSQYAFKGDIEVVGGRAQGNYNEAVFAASFGGKGMKGDFYSRRGEESNGEFKAGLAIVINANFLDNAILDGKINNTAGHNTYTFGNSASTNSIEGSVRAQALFDKNVSNTITFNGAGQIKGLISTDYDAFAGTEKNTITFEKEGIIGTDATDNTNIIVVNAGENIIEFKDNGTIHGNIHAIQGINAITASKKLTLKGKITIEDNGNASANKILFKQATDFNAEDLTVAQNSGAAQSKYNLIMLEGADNTITVGQLSATSTVLNGNNDSTFKHVGNYFSLNNNGSAHTVKVASMKSVSDRGKAITANVFARDVIAHVENAKDMNLGLGDNLSGALGSEHEINGSVSVGQISNTRGVNIINAKEIIVTSANGTVAEITSSQIGKNILSSSKLISLNYSANSTSSKAHLYTTSGAQNTINLDRNLATLTSSDSQIVLTSDSGKNEIKLNGQTGAITRDLIFNSGANGENVINFTAGKGILNLKDENALKTLYVQSGQGTVWSSTGNTSITFNGNIITGTAGANSSDATLSFKGESNSQQNVNHVQSITFADNSTIIAQGGTKTDVDGQTTATTGKNIFNFGSSAANTLTIGNGTKILAKENGVNEFYFNHGTVTLTGVNLEGEGNGKNLFAFNATTTLNGNMNKSNNTALTIKSGTTEIKANTDDTLTINGTGIIDAQGGVTIFSSKSTVENLQIGAAAEARFSNVANTVNSLTFNQGGLLNISSKVANNTPVSEETQAQAKNFNLLTIGAADKAGLSGNGTALLYVDVESAAADRMKANESAQDEGVEPGPGAGLLRAAAATNTNTLGGLEATTTQEKYGNAYSDRIIISSATADTNNPKPTLALKVEVANGINDEQLKAISYDASNDNTSGDTAGGSKTAGNIALATVANGTSTNVANTDIVAYSGFDAIAITLTEKDTDDTGAIKSGGGYKTYFIDSAKNAGNIEADIAATTSAFMLNYDLFMANFNSLNKRMGELRNNAYSQGVWARVFNGGQTNDLGLGTKSNYTTIQAGYDYAFGFEGANNFLGFALSYAMSKSETKSSAFKDNFYAGLKDISSNAVEFALYNSYVGNGVNAKDLSSENWFSGFYNDTVLKFSYIFSDFSILNDRNQATQFALDKQSTSNFGFLLSNEVGYLVKLGENSEWGITPQVEFGFGYLNQSDFQQTLGKAYLNAIADSVLNFRSRIGSNFSYDFKNFTADKGMNAQLYVGTYYEYDVISGGNVNLTSNLNELVEKSNLESNGRFVLNVGTNLEVQDATRIYFDFEKSFAGKINTDYQVNVGVRYSFGENTSYKPMQASKKEAPALKIDEEETQKQEVQSTKKEDENKSSDNEEKNNSSSTKKQKKSK